MTNNTGVKYLLNRKHDHICITYYIRIIIVDFMNTWQIMVIIKIKLLNINIGTYIFMSLGIWRRSWTHESPGTC